MPTQTDRLHPAFVPALCGVFMRQADDEDELAQVCLRRGNGEAAVRHSQAAETWREAAGQLAEAAATWRVSAVRLPPQ